jgi:hypothetical protein
MVTPLRHSADGRSITDKLNGYQFLLILVLALPCWRFYDAMPQRESTIAAPDDGRKQLGRFARPP